MWSRLLRDFLASASIVLLAATMEEAGASDGSPRDERLLADVTVRATVEWARIQSPNMVGGAYCERNFSFEAKNAVFSPSGERFVILVAKGNIESNRVIYTLLSYRRSEVDDLFSARQQVPPRGEVVAEVAASSELGAISGVRWIDDSRLAFLADAGDGVSQVFIHDFVTGEREQVTRHPTDVVSFDLRGDRVVYLAVQPAKLATARVARETQYATHLLSPKTTPVGRRAIVAMYSASKSTREVRQIDLRTMNLMCGSWRLWMSPSGRYAVALVPSVSPPSYWDEYAAPLAMNYGLYKDFSDPLDVAIEWHTRLQLVDLETGATRPLLDAPSGSVALNRTPREIFWMKGETSVIASNTYLPLNTTDPIERRRRAKSPAIAEIDIHTGNARAIMWESVKEVRVDPASSYAQSIFEPILGLDWNEGSDVLVVERQNTAGGVRRISFKRSRNEWQPLKDATLQVHATGADSNAGLTIQIEQSLNRRPKVVISDARCACSHVLLDPNPNADALAFALAEKFSWRDPSNAIWNGVLLKPRGFDASRRYPLVVQTHGIDDTQFYLTGKSFWGVGSYAAQALASAGFVVLEVEDNNSIGYSRRYAKAWAEAYKSAIDKLVSLGIVDAKRVGLTAWSATGGPTETLLELYPHLLSAAVMSDTGFDNYFAHIQGLGYVDPRMAIPQSEGKVGAFGVDAASIGAWMATRPLYRMSGVSTAIRFEAWQPGTALCTYEAWALLKARGGTPTEFVYIPADNHWLFEPAHLESSISGTLDWYLYWLQGYEDPHEGKADQYRRWAKLRPMRDAHAAGE
jgi:dipeptidyl aminopeptidase/acylaminoacyl peptidase